MPRTFLDAGVLITAARGARADQERTFHIWEDPSRTFVVSPFLHLELLPKAIFNRRALERDLYAKYFGAAESIDDLDQIVAVASSEAERAGLAAMDALHLAAAHLGECDEFITTEKHNSPIHRSSLVKIVYLYD